MDHQKNTGPGLSLSPPPPRSGKQKRRCQKIALPMECTRLCFVPQTRSPPDGGGPFLGGAVCLLLAWGSRGVRGDCLVWESATSIFLHMAAAFYPCSAHMDGPPLAGTRRRFADNGWWLEGIHERFIVSVLRSPPPPF